MRVDSIYCCILAFLFSVQITLTGCSISQHTGGTGVGNPSGTTVVSIVADTLSTEGTLPINKKTYEAPVPIIDDSLTLLATSAYIVVQKIYFILDDNDKNDSLLSLYSGPLTFEDDNVILDGPFVFDALTGVCDIPFNSISLPEVRYKGIKLDIGNHDSTLMEGYTIILAGELYFDNTPRKFSIKLDLDKDMRPYLIDGPAILTEENDDVEFQLTLNANRWLDNMDIKTDYLNDGSISFDPVSGDLNINKSTGPNAYKDFNKAVRMNMFNSGTLQIIID